MHSLIQPLQQKHCLEYLRIAYQSHWIDSSKGKLEGNLSHLALHSQKIHTALQHVYSPCTLKKLINHGDLGTDHSHTHPTHLQQHTALTYQSFRQCVDSTDNSHTHKECCKIITAFVVI